MYTFVLTIIPLMTPLIFDCLVYSFDNIPLIVIVSCVDLKYINLYSYFLYNFGTFT